MKYTQFLFLAFLGLSLTFTACKDDPVEPDPIPPVLGCTDINALTYNPNATQDDGTCEYAKAYFPFAVGNEWHLEDAIDVLGTAYTVNADFEITGDTLIKTGPYRVSEEYLGTDQFSQDSRFAYRTEASGKVYRIDLADPGAAEILFLDYPLTMGHTWYDTEAEDHYSCEVVFHDVVSVPAGTFSDVVGVQYTDLSNAQEFTLYFAPGVGIVKADVSINFQIFNFDVNAELINYTVN